MNRRYPQEIVALLRSIENARLRLHQEIERTRRLLREVEEQMQISASTR